MKQTCLSVDLVLEPHLTRNFRRIPRYTPFSVNLYKYLFYKNIEAEVCEILWEHFESKPEADIFKHNFMR